MELAPDAVFGGVQLRWMKARAMDGGDAMEVDTSGEAAQDSSTLSVSPAPSDAAAAERVAAGNVNDGIDNRFMLRCVGALVVRVKCCVLVYEHV